LSYRRAAKEQRKRQSEAIGVPDWAQPLAERDWVPLVAGLGLAIGGVFFVIGCIHIYLRIF
jgi:hypothetical protein